VVCRLPAVERLNQELKLAIKILLLRSICCPSPGSNCRGLKQKVAPVQGSFWAMEMSKLHAVEYSQAGKRDSSR